MFLLLLRSIAHSPRWCAPRPLVVRLMARFYDFEKEALFNHEWLCVGRVDWVKEQGDYFTTTIIGEPIIVTSEPLRRDQGDVGGVPAPRHAGGRGAGQHPRLRLSLSPLGLFAERRPGERARPWSAPATSTRRPSSCRPSRSRSGWASSSSTSTPPRRPLAPRLTAVEDAIANYDLSNAEGLTPADDRPVRLELEGDVREQQRRLPRQQAASRPAARLHPQRAVQLPGSREGDAGFLRYNGTTHPDVSFNPTQKAVLPIFPKLTDEDRNRATFANIPPTLSLVMTSDMVIYLILRPTGPETMEQDTGIWSRPAPPRLPASRSGWR
jgi:hypothetical protein